MLDLVLPPPLDVAWARLVGGAATPAEVHASLSSEGFAVPGSAEVRVREHFVRFDFADRLRPYRAILDQLAPLGLACAPVVLGEIGGTEGALLTRYAAAAGEELVRVADDRSSVPAAARARLRQDLTALRDAGLCHPYAHRGVAHWWRSRPSGVLVLDGWQAARPWVAADEEEVWAGVDRALRSLE
ncbi:MAG: hypothetical protein ABMA64_15395 [Myxococcota bacterium]